MQTKQKRERKGRKERRRSRSRRRRRRRREKLNQMKPFLSDQSPTVLITNRDLLREASFFFFFFFPWRYTNMCPRQGKGQRASLLFWRQEQVIDRKENPRVCAGG
jgi:hypothetical protein